MTPQDNKFNQNTEETNGTKKNRNSTKTNQKFRGRVVMGIRKLIFSLSEIKFINNDDGKRIFAKRIVLHELELKQNLPQ